MGAYQLSSSSLALYQLAKDDPFQPFHIATPPVLNMTSHFFSKYSSQQQHEKASIASTTDNRRWCRVRQVWNLPRIRCAQLRPHPRELHLTNVWTSSSPLPLSPTRRHPLPGACIPWCYSGHCTRRGFTRSSKLGPWLVLQGNLEIWNWVWWKRLVWAQSSRGLIWSVYCVHGKLVAE